MRNVWQQAYNSSPIILQNLLLNSYALYIHIERFEKLFLEYSEALDRTQWYSYSQLQQYQNETLQRLIHHAYDTVPHYHRVMRERKLVPSDIKTLNDLMKLPILTRQDVKQNSDSLISSQYKKYQIIKGHTSGTTGSPLEFYWDFNVCRFHNAADWRQKAWARLRYRERYAVLQGRTIVPLVQIHPPFWRMNFLHNQLFLSSFHLKKTNLPAYVDKLREFRPSVLEGYPSTIYVLARFLLETGQVLPLKAILTSSETLHSVQRETIQRAFAAPLFDFYGLAERVIFATECDRHEGHHLNMEYGITEIVRPDGDPVNPGTVGRIIATGLHNFAMPLIRYQTSDITAIKDKKCSCGRALPLIDDITTKAEDIVVLPDGRLMSPSVLTHPFKPMHNVEASQIIQEDPYHIIVKIVRGPTYSDEDSNTLMSALRQRLGHQTNITFDFVQNVPRDPSGKYRWVVSKVPLPF